ncbi:acyl-CoA thioesterase [Streptomyces rubradiris]|uniref:Acyl-CoA thioesterase II n=1 Tax=Streptomyces rubradiris TaxID=285531 RepID=A0ABQ3RQV1_STRRR|nr:acyl-CoA thioesterase II [Streptomyces rubradiris]GHH24811.1 acyl-CoA thioesterase II [Streptomyces rubradiris]GHI58234.1 acyl-CoA thioesterase II [Streptomyces rubradiris]
MTTTLPLADAPARLLTDSLVLDATAPDTFRSRRSVPAGVSAVFGGQIVAQALSAAARTVPQGREPHSLHGYFLFRGDPAQPITYRVERLRDGHSFSSRRVVAVQTGGRAQQEIFHLTASFKRTSRPGEDHQIGMPPAPSPHRLPHAVDEPPAQVHPGVIRLLSDLRDVIDVRYVHGPAGAPAGVRADTSGTVTRVWFRVRGLPPGTDSADPALHHCLLAYLSDLTLLDSASPHHRTGRPNEGNGIAVSLDHAMWFHRPLSADEWLLYEQRSPTSADGRALVHARIYTADGTLAATVVQEGVIRPGRTPGLPHPSDALPEPDIDPFSWTVAKPETD